MQLSQNQKIFSEFFSAFLESPLKFGILKKKKDDPQSLFAFEIIDWKKRGYLNA